MNTLQTPSEGVAQHGVARVARVAHTITWATRSLHRVTAAFYICRSVEKTSRVTRTHSHNHRVTQCGPATGHTHPHRPHHSHTPNHHRRTTMTTVVGNVPAGSRAQEATSDADR